MRRSPPKSPPTPPHTPRWWAHRPVSAGGEELERGEAVHFHCLHLVGRGVHLGNDYVLVVLVGLSQLIPDGGQLLAVTAPWGIELYKVMYQEYQMV